MSDPEEMCALVAYALRKYFEQGLRPLLIVCGDAEGSEVELAVTSFLAPLMAQNPDYLQDIESAIHDRCTEIRGKPVDDWGGTMIDPEKP